MVYVFLAYPMKIVETHCITNFHASSKSHEKAINIFHELMDNHGFFMSHEFSASLKAHELQHHEKPLKGDEKQWVFQGFACKLRSFMAMKCEILNAF